MLIMLFRCMERRYATSFLKQGTFRMGTPEEWIAYEQQGEKGRGDQLEGVYARHDMCDINALKLSKELRGDDKPFTECGITYHRS